MNDSLYSNKKYNKEDEAGKSGRSSGVRSTDDDLFENIDEILTRKGFSTKDKALSTKEKEVLMSLFLSFESDFNIKNFENFLDQIKNSEMRAQASAQALNELLDKFPKLNKEYNDYIEKEILEGLKEASSKKEVKWIDSSQPIRESHSENYSKFISYLFKEALKLEEEERFRIKWGRPRSSGGRRKSRKSRKNKTNKRKNYKR